MKFQKILKKEMDLPRIDSLYSFIDSKYLTIHFGKCTKKDFCDWLMDVNNTFQPLTFNNLLNLEGIESTKEKESMQRMRKDIIIVHIEFMNSEVEMTLLDTKYSTMDKISNIGGLLGLGEQITGASALALFHLVILILKGILAHFNLYVY